MTGGVAGLGLAIARRLLADGWWVHVLDMDSAGGEALVATYTDVPLTFAAVDVSDRDAVHAAISAHGGPRLDLLVNNAGIVDIQPLERLSADSWRRVLAVNLDGAFYCLQAAGRLMLEQGGGAVVNIVSIAAERGAPGRASYCVSKAGLVALTRVAAVEWAGRGVRVNAVAPGYTQTALLTRALDAGLLDRHAILSRIPAGRLGAPEEVAAAVAYLASDDAAYVTGQVLTVDGGFLADYGVASAPPEPDSSGNED